MIVRLLFPQNNIIMNNEIDEKTYKSNKIKKAASIETAFKKTL